MLVLPDADLDLAADAAVNSGFGSAGERCMAISALVAVEPIADELVSKIKDRMGKLRTGDGTKGCDMGPLVTKAHRDKVAGYVNAGLEEGATLVVDGRDDDFDGGDNGFFLGPTLFDNVGKEMSIYTDEIFGPVLSVVRVDSYDEGLELINSNPYGNGTAIFTNDGGAARRFQRQVEVGMVGVNVPIPVPVSYYSFGGWKNSLFGDTHAHGLEVCTSSPAARWSPRAGSTRATAASTSASRRTPEVAGGWHCHAASPRRAPPTRWTPCGGASSARGGSPSASPPPSTRARANRCTPWAPVPKRRGPVRAAVGAPAAYGSYEALVADPAVDVVYVARPTTTTARPAGAGGGQGCGGREADGAERGAVGTCRRWRGRAGCSSWRRCGRCSCRSSTSSASCSPTVRSATCTRCWPTWASTSSPATASGADLAGGPPDLGTYPVMLATWALGAPSQVSAVGTFAPTG